MIEMADKRAPLLASSHGPVMQDRYTSGGGAVRAPSWKPLQRRVPARIKLETLGATGILPIGAAFFGTARMFGEELVALRRFTA